MNGEVEKRWSAWLFSNLPSASVSRGQHKLEKNRGNLIRRLRLSFCK